MANDGEQSNIAQGSLHERDRPTTTDERSDDTWQTARQGLPQPLLPHADQFLSPLKTSHFDVDAFLVSRTTGQTLGEITSELQRFGSKLRHELDEVVDRDFRGFVNLGVALKAERPRIARLDWKVAQEEGGHEQTAEGGSGERRSRKSTNAALFDSFATHSDLPSTAGGNLGLERVRVDVVEVRDQLRKAQESIRQTVARKEAVEKERRSLQVLLTFADSLDRLESLLLPGEEALASERSTDDDAGDDHDGPSSTFWKAFESMDVEEQSEVDGEEGEGDYTSSSSDEEGVSISAHRIAASTVETAAQAKHQSTRKAPVRRRSSGIAAARRRSSLGVNTRTALSTSPSRPTLTLPSRIARASSEHAALMFLAEQTIAMGHEEYIIAHEARLSRVRQALETDLRSLVVSLTSFAGASLLVSTRVENDESDRMTCQKEKSLLLGWSQVPEGSVDERRKEQMSWLEMALATWTALPQRTSSSRENDTSEAEECIRRALVEPWARSRITPSSLGVGSVEMNGPLTAQTQKRPSHFSLSLNLAGSDDDNMTKSKPLVVLYNDILSFVANDARLASLAANSVQQSSSEKQTNVEALSHNQSLASLQDERYPACNVYVRSLWREIGTRLMEQLGGQLFFVGRPEDFRRNYTVSMAFLRAFEQLAPSSSAAKVFRRDPVYIAFRKRWQLSVYFQMRFREIVSSFEATLQSNSIAQYADSLEKHSSHVLPLTTSTRSALVAFGAPWAKESHVRELSHREWRLSLQVVSRFRSWMQEELPQDVLPAHRRVIDASRSNAPPSRSSFEQQRLHSTPPYPGSSVGSPTRAGTPTSHDVDSDNHLMNVCTALAADILWFDHHVRSSFEANVVPAFVVDEDGSGESSMAPTLRETLNGALNVLHTQTLPLLANKVTAILKARSAEPLRLVRSVSTQYRSATQLTSGAKDAFVEPSFFVYQFLRPIRHYLGKAESGPGRQQHASKTMTTTTNETLSAVEVSSAGSNAPNASLSSLLPKEVRQQWIGEVLEDFVIRYTASLHTMSKNFESLQRLKRVNAVSTSSNGEVGGGGSGGAAELGNEADRMHLQMMADVDQLEREVKELADVDTHVATDTPAWRKLKAAARSEAGSLDE